MAASRQNIDIALLVKTRSSVYKLTIYLFGLTRKEKMRHANAAAEYFLENSLDEILRLEMCDLGIDPSLNNPTKRKNILDYLKHNIFNLQDAEIDKRLKDFVRDEAKKRKALPAIAALKQHRDQAKKFLTTCKGDDILQKSSENLWTNSTEEMSKLVTPLENIFPAGYKDMLDYACRAFLLYLIVTKQINFMGRFEDKNMTDILTDGVIMFILGAISTWKIFTTFLTPEVKPNFQEMDAKLDTRFEELSKAYLESKWVPKGAATRSDDTSSPTSEEKMSYFSEDKSGSPKEQRKKRPTPLVIEESKAPQIQVDKIYMERYTYIRMNYQNHPNCFFKYNRDEIEAKISRGREKLIMPKIKNSINTRRVGYETGGGVVLVTEAQQDKFTRGKVWIPEDERLDVDIRDATKEEKTFDESAEIREVISPKAMCFH